MPARTPRTRTVVNERGEVVDFQVELSQRKRLENMLWRRIEEAGLPQPELEYRFARSEGRMFRADGAYVEARLLLEVEGGIWAANPGRHNRGSGFEVDATKYNLAAVLGWRVLRFTERLIKSGGAVDTIKRALQPVQLVVEQLPLNGYNQTHRNGAGATPIARPLATREGTPR